MTSTALKRLPFFESPSPLARSALVVALFWYLLCILSRSNLDGYGDMLEGFAWGQEWSWGTHKHPPFFAWVAKIWFGVFPQTDWAFYLLSFTAVWISLYGIALLCKEFLPDPRAPYLVILLLALAFPYTSLAAKFNANSILLPLWPWTALLFLRAIAVTHAPMRWVYSVGLGLLAAACMLGKYYSAILLCTLFFISLLPRYRHWYQSFSPYLSLGVFLLALAPHVNWLAQHDWASIYYAQEQRDSDDIDWGDIAKFALSPLLYWCLPLGLVLTWGYTGSFAQRCKLCLQSQGFDDALFWLATLPLLTTLVCGLLNLASLSLPWSIPIGFAYPILLLRGLSNGRMETLFHKIQRALPYAACALLVLACVYRAQQSLQGLDNYYLPRAEASAAVQKLWLQQHPESGTLAWAAGNWPEVGSLAFYQNYQNQRVRALPSPPDAYPASLIPQTHWQAENGVFFCPMGWLKPTDSTSRNDCTQQAEKWLAAKGLQIEAHSIVVRKNGWFYAQNRPYRYLVYFVPKTQ